MMSARKPRPYARKTLKEIRKILKLYDDAEPGFKWKVLVKYEVHYSHVYAWRKRLNK